MASNYLSKKLESTDKHKIFVITSQSHKAIENLLIATANKISQKSTMNIFKYGGEKLDENKIGYLKNKDELAIKISEFEKSNTPIIVGMTVFAICSWGRPFDLIVIDEAGQYSLSNSIAASLYAKQGIFLGDQNQLPNVSQASHPYPVDTSVMDHSVGSYTVIPSEAGIFINKTWRLHPKMDIISHAYYDGRLTPSKNMPKSCI